LYNILKASSAFNMELMPLLSVRGYHDLMHANDSVNKNYTFQNNIFQTKAYKGTPDIFIKVPGALFSADPKWFYNFNYSIDQERGLSFVEDLFTHGKFSVTLKEGDSVGIILSTENPAEKDAHELMLKEDKRKKGLLNDELFTGSTDQLLALAADQFIVKRTISYPNGSEFDGASVIAGYHWFTDWSRDTMISLPGLTLSTGRYEEAKKILTAFAHSANMGMLPNRFQDGGRDPEYNTVDGTLWFFIAVHKYLTVTNDKDFVLHTILPVLKNIIDWHYKGTRYNIHVSADGLLYAGEKGQQLTWMDAKIGDWVVTPRMGKPVEIQALWYNALKIFAALLQLNNQQKDALIVDANAETARSGFNELFWFTEGSYLYDNIDEHGNPDTSVRPNQLFTISLPFALIDGERAKAVFQVVKEQLYTPVGLRSLSCRDPRYIHLYEGDQLRRDSSYHQGTVWSWLLGPYTDALIKVKGEDGKAEAKTVIENFKYHLNEACIGSVSEIFDGDAPHRPKGCIAQAWGVAEVLRIIKEHGLA
jgi:predicted glycogen debranching enzyme